MATTRRICTDILCFFILSGLFLIVAHGETTAGENKTPHPDFAYIADYASDAVIELRFYNGHNFIGTRIDGYLAEKPMMVREAAQAIGRANEAFKKKGYRIKIFDAYRPQSAVDHFMRWGNEPDNPEMKKLYYPHFDKDDLFELVRSQE